MNKPARPPAMFMLTPVARACGVFIRDLQQPGFAATHLWAMDLAHHQSSYPYLPASGRGGVVSSTAPLKV